MHSSGKTVKRGKNTDYLDYSSTVDKLTSGLKGSVLDMPRFFIKNILPCVIYCIHTFLQFIIFIIQNVVLFL